MKYKTQKKRQGSFRAKENNCTSNKKVVTLIKDENGWDESRSVRNRMPFFPVRFRFSG